MRLTRDFVERRRDAAARWIAQHVHLIARVEHRGDQMIQRRDIALHVRLESQLAARTEHRNAVIADRTGQNHHVAGLGVRAADFHSKRQRADAGRIDVKSIRLAALHHLRIARDDLHAGFFRRRAHRFDDARQRIERQTFFENESHRQVQRRRAHHRDIVHRAANREFANIAAGEAERRDDVRIGADRKSRARAGLHDSGVVAGAQRGVIERWKK